MAKLFFLFSGEHTTLPFAELKAILEAENHTFAILETLDQATRLEAESASIESIRHRAAYTKICGLELFCCKAEKEEIFTVMRAVDLTEILKKNESFAVRVVHVKNYASTIDTMTLERDLGKIIQSQTTAKVNLKTPNKTFLGILTSGKFIFGLKIAEILPKPFVERRPKKKPFFHPSAMQAKLARCMVNLARTKTGEIVFDPFCGTGSMLIEAALVGCKVLGLDVQHRMAKGALRNLRYFGISPEGVIVGDSRNPPITTVDCVVTDPPYGRSATTMRRTTKQLVEDFLTAIYDILSKSGKVCIATPKTLNVKVLGEALNYKHLESHLFTSTEA